MDPFSSIQRAFSLVIQKEKQREVGNVQTPLDSQLACVVQGSQNSKSGNKKDKGHPLCTHCGLLGHTKDKCFKIIKYPPGHKKHKSTVNLVNDNQGESSNSFNIAQCQQLLNFIQSQMARAMNSETSQSDQSNLGMIFSTHGQSFGINSSSWIIDSRATSHICHDLKLFDQYTQLSN